MASRSKRARTLAKQRRATTIKLTRSCGKLKFMTPTFAHFYARGYKLRVYKCDKCDGYHLTSKPLRRPRPTPEDIQWAVDAYNELTPEDMEPADDSPHPFV